MTPWAPATTKPTLRWSISRLNARMVFKVCGGKGEICVHAGKERHCMTSATSANMITHTMQEKTYVKKHNLSIDRLSRQPCSTRRLGNFVRIVVLGLRLMLPTLFCLVRVFLALFAIICLLLDHLFLNPACSRLKFSHRKEDGERRDNLKKMCDQV